MKHYFIDYENVHDGGLSGIDKIGKDSIIYLLYSDACKSVSMFFLEKVLSKEIQVKLYKTETGKNALDFQLSSLLGYIIKSNEKSQDRKSFFKKQIEQPVKHDYFIISKDHGFDSIIEFWKQRDVNIYRVHNLAGDVTVPTAKKKAVANIPQVTKEELLKYLNSDEYSDEILKVVNSYKTKLAIHNGFAKVCKDSSKASAVYGMIKPLLKEKGRK